MPSTLNVSNNFKSFGSSKSLHSTSQSKPAIDRNLTLINNLLSFNYVDQTEGNNIFNSNAIYLVVINTLKARFSSGQIYTFIGDILIALNPFSDQFESILYGAEKINQVEYSINGSAHIYYIAYKAISLLRSTGLSQSIIISGESGSGKTRSCHHLLNYFTTISPNSKLLKLVCSFGVLF